MSCYEGNLYAWSPHWHGRQICNRILIYWWNRAWSKFHSATQLRVPLEKLAILRTWKWGPNTAIPHRVVQVEITICVLGAGLLQNVGFVLFQGNISVCAGQMSELKETTDIQIMGNQTKHTAPHYERKKKQAYCIPGISTIHGHWWYMGATWHWHSDVRKLPPSHCN